MRGGRGRRRRTRQRFRCLPSDALRKGDELGHLESLWTQREESWIATTVDVSFMNEGLDAVPSCDERLVGLTVADERGGCCAAASRHRIVAITIRLRACNQFRLTKLSFVIAVLQHTGIEGHEQSMRS